MFKTFTFSSADFLRLLNITSFSYMIKSDGPTVQIPLRFFLHYSDDTIDFIQRMLPKVNAQEMETIMRFYGINKKEMGERYIRSKFLDKMAKRSHQLFLETQDDMSPKDFNAFMEILMSFNHILYKTEDLNNLI